MIQVTLLAIQLLLFEKYIVSNLTVFGQEHRDIEWLLLCIAVATVNNLLLLIASRRVCLRASGVLLALFFIYFAYRCSVDLYDKEWWRQFIGSDAGMLYHFLLGVLTAAPVSYAISQGDRINPPSRMFKYFVVLFLIVTTIDSFSLALTAMERSRGDLFLVESGDDLYQWPGDLLSMRTLVLTMLAGYVVSLGRNTRNALHRYGRYLVTLVLTLQFGASIFFVQILGSNKAVFIIISCWLCLVSLLFASRIVRHVTKHGESRLFGVLSVMRASLLGTGKLSLAFGALLFAAAVQMDFPFEKFRVFGFGSGEMSSLDSRLDLLAEGFVSQFSISPLFGHAAADYLTLGEGRYIHSTLAYTLTHTGIVGFFLLTSALCIALIEKRFRIYVTVDRFGNCQSRGWELPFLALLLFLMMLLAGAISSSLVWGAGWFAFGLFWGLGNSKGLHLKLTGAANTTNWRKRAKNLRLERENQIPKKKRT